MSMCVACGQRLPEGAQLCAQHAVGLRTDWATGNRVMCDLLHRGIAPGRPPDVDDDVAERPPDP